MMNSEFEFIRTLVYSKSRINLGPDKRELVAARLGKRLRATKLASVGDYCRLLQSGENPEELGQLIDAISTNHTFFFREVAHFDYIRQKIAPEMIARARKERWNSFNAWSAACSSGEEPYTLGIVLSECLDAASLPWRIQATDISTRVLEKARNAVYSTEQLEHVAPAHVRQHFQRGIGPQEGNYRVKASLRSKVEYNHLNLLEGEPPFSELFQVIFCRNVMIYFDRQTQEELIRRLAARLVPGGYLLVGHSESLTGIKHSLQLVQSAIYKKNL
jgi:chemotaxis protein methyltransferase CheR